MALARYREIVGMAKAKGMKVVLTLFHHSLPVWVGEAGGWTNEAVVREFGSFVRDVAAGLGESVDYWLTMNEPMAFALFTYIEGTWPQAFPQSNYLEVVLKALQGDERSVKAAVDNLAGAHNLAYSHIHQVHTLRGWRAPQVGMAARAQILEGKDPWDGPAVMLSREFMDFTITDKIQDRLDFLGLNYYGKEIISGQTIAQPTDVGYSEAGRAIDTAVSKGIDVFGYIHWTISDNWEWADGYCPKFGLYSVDRSHVAVAHAHRAAVRHGVRRHLKVRRQPRAARGRVESRRRRRVGWRRIQLRPHRRRRRLELGRWRGRPAGPRRRAEPATAQEDRGLCWPARRRCDGWKMAQPRPHRRRQCLELGRWSLWPAGPRRRAGPAAAQEGRGLGWPARRRCVGRRRSQHRHQFRRRLYLGQGRPRLSRPRRGPVEPAAAQEDRGVGAGAVRRAYLPRLSSQSVGLEAEVAAVAAAA